MKKQKNKKRQPHSSRRTAVGRELEAMHRLASSLLAENGLDNWSVFWEEALEKSDSGGLTRAHSSHIVFSAAFLAMMSPGDRRDAVRHEVAHAIIGVNAEHSDEWREKAVELGGSGRTSPEVDSASYPWRGHCPDQHVVFSALTTFPTEVTCGHEEHDAPVIVRAWKRVSQSRAFDPSVKRMAATYPEPVPSPAFTVGDAVYLIPFGNPAYDNAPLTITKVGKRTYETLHGETGEEVSIVFEGVLARPS